MLLDLSLPDGSGLDVLAEVQRRGRVPAVVTAMTGHDDAATRRRCLDAGCGMVLVKPVASRELLRLLDLWAAEAAAPPKVP
jgi:DNA-binding response OmpR family regulator